MGKERNKQIRAIEQAVDEAARRWFAKDRAYTTKAGREDDLSIPADKRRDSYGQSIINRPGPRMEAEDYEYFVRAVDSGNGTVDPHHRDGAAMHAKSLRGHARADAIARAAIEEARRQRK